MLNSVTLIGKLAGRPVETDNNPAANVTHKVALDVENTDEQNHAVIDICIWEPLAQTINEKYSEGTVVGIKGYLQDLHNQLYVVATRVSFMTPVEADND